MQIVTLATAATLPRARVLARSVQRHEPDWPVEIVLVGAPRAAEPREGYPEPRALSDLLDLDVESLLGSRSEDDLLALLLPPLLRFYAERARAPVVHLPPGWWALGRLEPLAGALARRSVMLVPRTAADVPDDGLEPTPEQLEFAGRFNESAIGVDGTAGAEGFLGWWNGCLEEALGSLDGSVARGRPEDRGWLPRMLELAPARFGTAVLSDPGCNLSLWNLHRHSLASADGAVVVDAERPLRLLDLSGYEPDHPYRLSRNASRVRLSRSAVIRELCGEYARELAKAGWTPDERRAQIGRRLANGLLYDEPMRALQDVAEGLGERFGDVFSEAGSRAFTAWLAEPARAAGGSGVSRYVFYRVARERPDVLRAYPQLDGPDAAGYLAWCRSFGREEMAIPDCFLPAPGRDACEPDRAAEGEPGEAEGTGGQDGGSAVPGVPGASDDSPAESATLAVRVTGYLGHALGLGAAARAYAQALQAAGVPVITASVPLHHMQMPAELGSDYGRHAFSDIVRSDLAHGFEIIAVNADELQAFVERLGEDYFQGPRIGIWGWETNAIPARWEGAFSLVDEIWVYSRFMAENIGAVAPVPVIALPPPVQPPGGHVTPLRLGMPEEAFLFLFVFDYLSTIQRKNPVGLIEAFKRAFAPGEGPLLLIKTINAPLRPLAEEEVLWAARGRPDIHVVDRSLSGPERDGLMAACDCYVSLHRSEGFGLTLAEAMVIGKPVIATRYSGNLDFMTDQNSFLVDFRLARVGPDCEIYPADGEWAEPDLEQAAGLMRAVYERPQEAARLGARAREDVLGALSAEATGAAMRGRLEQLARRTGSRLDRGPSVAVGDR